MLGGWLAYRDAQLYESCYFMFQNAPLTYKDDAMIKLWVDEVVGADFFVFKGKDRSTATPVNPITDTEGNSYYTMKADEGLILVS